MPLKLLYLSTYFYWLVYNDKKLNVFKNKFMYTFSWMATLTMLVYF